MSSPDYPIDISSEQFSAMNTFFTGSAIEANTTGTPKLQYPTSLMVPVLGDPRIAGCWSEQFSGAVGGEATTGSSQTTASSQEYPERACHLSWFPVEGDNRARLPVSTYQGVDVPAVGAQVASYAEARSHSSNSRVAHHPAHRRHKYGRISRRIGDGTVQDRSCDYPCTVANCGQFFSGQSERKRHIKSKHGPPTIGCRKCKYKQSRRDLFRDHCKKWHPGESMDALLVQLVQGGGAHNQGASLRMRA
jgi:hypothetical protein